MDSEVGTTGGRGEYLDFVWQHDPTIPAPARFRRACRYRAFVPDELAGLNPVLPADVFGSLAEAEESIRRLDRHPLVTSRLTESFRRMLLRSEAVASSKIEGYHIELRALARAAVERDAGRTVSTRAAEILRNVDAIDYAITIAANEVPTVEQICEIHSRLMTASAHPEIAGRIRTTQNWIGGNDFNPCGAAFVPPPADHVERLLLDLVAYQSDGDPATGLMRAAIIHAQFETIHPFADGNGRTGRALIQVELQRSKVATNLVPPISVALAKQRDRYIAGLTAFRDGDLERWFFIFATAATHSVSVAERYIHRIVDLQSRWQARMAMVRDDSAVWPVMWQLPAFPVFSAAHMLGATRRSAPAVNHAIDQLVDAGIIEQTSAGRRNRVWEAPEALDLLTEVEADLADW